MKDSMRSIAYILTVIFIIFSPVDIGATGLGQEGKGQWKLVMKLHQEEMRIIKMALTDLTASMKSLKVNSNVKDNNLELSGTHDFGQIRTILFDTVAQWVDFLGGPIELTLEIPTDNNSVTFLMETRMTAGYRWEVLPAAKSRYFQKGESLFTPRYGGHGTPYLQTIQIQSGGAGDSTVTLVYRRPFQKDAPIKSRLNITVMGIINVIELSDPTLSEPEMERTMSDSEAANHFLELKESLPSAWDWRTQIPNIVPDVRDQGSCGSCWAFGTVGVMESALKKGGGPLADLSEQFLVSCNNSGWSCSGGLTAHKYHYDTLGKNQAVIGAVLESDKPYTATNGTCTVAYNHPYKLNSWQFITGSEWTMPTNDQLKNAIYTYGPVTAGVCVDSGWYAYTGGVYVTLSNVCGGSTNHQIILVGWDDATQTWILRNSWGPTWGESGYMRIKYDPAGSTSRVGEGTSWVTSACTYSISPMYPTVGASSGTGTVSVTASGRTCAWTAVSNAAWITVTSGSSGTGNGTVNYSYTANAGSTREGTITVANKTFILTQRAVSSLQPTVTPIISLLLDGVPQPPACPVVSNGGFESGHAVWTEYSTHGWDLIVSSLPVTPHGGSWAVWLGGDYDETSYIQQQLTVSSSCPYLVFYHWIGSEDVCGWDYGYTRINGAVVDTVNLCDSYNTGGWVAKSINLGSYAGQTVTLQIGASTDSSYNSNWFIDDVAFHNTAAAQQPIGAETPYSPPARKDEASMKSSILKNE